MTNTILETLSELIGEAYQLAGSVVHGHANEGQQIRLLDILSHDAQVLIEQLEKQP